MEQHVFTISMIMEGTAEKVLQLMLPLKSIDIKNFGFIQHKCVFEHYKRFKQENFN